MIKMQVNIEIERNKLKHAIAKIIKDLRLSRHKSISLICAEIGMTKSMWADLEKGIKDPQLSTFFRIAEALDIPLSKLIIQLENKLGDNFSFID